MARIRSIKPEFRTSLTATSWPRDVRLFFVLLWGYLDDEGRGVDEPRLIKADCFPLDDDLTAAVVDEWLDLMAETGTVVRYEAGGRRYLCVPGWPEHQKTQHPKPSRIPAPHAEKIAPDDSKIPERLTESLMRDSGGPHEVRLPEQGAGSREQGGGRREDNPSSPAADAAADQPAQRDAAQDQPPGAGAPGPPDKNDREDVRRLCGLLAELMVENGCKPPTINKTWRDNARLMIDADGRDPDKAAELIRWSQKNSFWRTNIQSMPTFRAKYDQLRLQALEQWQKERNGSAPNGKRHQSAGYHDGVALARRLHDEEEAQLALEGVRP